MVFIGSDSSLLAVVLRAWKKFIPDNTIIQTHSSVSDYRTNVQVSKKGTQSVVVYLLCQPIQDRTYRDLIELAALKSHRCSCVVACNSSEESIKEAAQWLGLDYVHLNNPSFEKKLFEHLEKPTSEAPRESLGHLTAREKSVLDGLRAGLTLKQIATALGLKNSTISTYKVRLMLKLGYETNAQLLRGDLNKG